MTAIPCCCDGDPVDENNANIHPLLPADSDLICSGLNRLIRTMQRLTRKAVVIILLSLHGVSDCVYRYMLVYDVELLLYPVIIINLCKLLFILCGVT